MESFLRGLPKAELHVHIEGTLEPELLFEMASRNGITVDYSSVAELRAAYQFTSLQDFLDVYYQGAAVLRTNEDFYDLALAYFERVVPDGVRRAEIFFDPQTHTERGVAIGAVIEGLAAACAEAEGRLDMTTGLILCFLRDRSQDAAMATLEDAMEFRDSLLGVGLDSSEVGHPPLKFLDVFARARSEGLRTVAHAGEEGPPDYVRGALDHLGAERIDHGNRALEDPDLVARLRDEAIPLTVCPLSNVKLGVVERIEEHPLPDMLKSGLTVVINSDDPSYFGGYIGDTYIAVHDGLGFAQDRMVDLARVSITTSFASPAAKRAMLAELDDYVGNREDVETG